MTFPRYRAGSCAAGVRAHRLLSGGSWQFQGFSADLAFLKPVTHGECHGCQHRYTRLSLLCSAYRYPSLYFNLSIDATSGNKGKPGGGKVPFYG